MAKKLTKIIFTSAPPNTAYFVGIEQNVPEDLATEYIKLGFAVPVEAPAKEEKQKAPKKPTKTKEESTEGRKE